MSTTYRTIEERVHPWTYHEFEKDRKEQVECAVEIIKALDYNSNVLVSAPVKSGKRQIAEIVALAYAKEGNQNEHYFITALNRLDTKKQIDELSKYNLDVIVLGVQRDSRNLIQKLSAVKNPNNIIVHFDESDYGTGIKNLFAKVFDICRKKGIKLVCYSATNEEAENSGFANVAKVIEMVPNALYKGAGWFLDMNLIYEPKPFFDGTNITQHGKEIIDWWLSQPDKPIAILRLTGGDKDRGLYKDFMHSSKKSLLTKNNIDYKFVDGSNSFDWMDEYKSLLEAYSEYGTRTLLVINQTCTRSTELGFHKHLAFLHDHRPNESNYSTLAQAYLRVAHYHQTGHRINIYGEREVFELAAGRITKEEFSGKLSSRMNRNITKTGKRLSKDEIHWYRPEDYITNPTILTNPDKLKEEIQSIWNRHIDNAKKPGAFASGNVYKGQDEAKIMLKLSRDNHEFLKEETNESLDNITTTKRHCFVYENVKASEDAIGGGTSATSTTTTKRHIEGVVRVYSLFHDGIPEVVDKETTSHATTDKSVFQTRKTNQSTLTERILK